MNPGEPLTTLGLAAAVANAVLRVAHEPRTVELWTDPPTQAVLRALHQRDAWFCASYDAEQGTVDVPLPRVPSLFD